MYFLRLCLLRVLLLYLELTRFDGFAIAVFELDDVDAPGKTGQVDSCATDDLHINYFFAGEIENLKAAAFVDGFLKLYDDKSSGRIGVKFYKLHIPHVILLKTILRPPHSGKCHEQ